MKMLINSIYPGVEGEGVRIGTTQIFVRLQGCRLGCRNCDSKDTWSFTTSFARSLEEVVRDIEALSNNNIFWVSITGGDPLDSQHRPSVLALLKMLCAKGFRVNLEAAGNIIVSDIFHLSDYLSFDYKTPSTGVVTDYRLILQLAHEYPGKFQIKSVARDEEDVLFAHQARQEVARVLGGGLGLSLVSDSCLGTGRILSGGTLSKSSGHQSPLGRSFSHYRAAAQVDLWHEEAGCLRSDCRRGDFQCIIFLDVEHTF